jgi:hypothetical protein
MLKRIATALGMLGLGALLCLVSSAECATGGTCAWASATAFTRLAALAPPGVDSPTNYR